ncbi:MAG TPA: hypothetical protein VGO80_09400 [Solirubrobacteraceae bacterium]|nr:hypothetical protein [Solirubrobacteraceae bacterium]
MTSAAGPAPSDPQQLRARRFAALAIAVVVIIVLTLGIKGCLNGRKVQALKDYNRDVAGLVQRADANSDDFFTELTTPGSSSNDVLAQINRLRLKAKAQTREAQNLSVPGDMKAPQRNLLLTLGLLEEAIGKVAEKIPAALSTDSATAEPAVVGITAEMQSFIAADVVYKRRTAALVKQELDDHDIGGQTIQNSQFLPNVGWLDAPTVARRIHADAGRGAGSEASTAPLAAGTHGHGLLAVSVGDVTLQAGETASNSLPAGSVTFNVKFANQGENPETDVRVRVTITGGGKTITKQQTVDQTTAGAETTTAIPLGEPPPIGVAVKIKVEVRKVRGESNVVNNVAEYPAIFRR